MPTTPDILAAFVSSWLFLGGSAAVAVPILIHLLARRRFRRIRWAAIAFLLEAERRNRRRIRVEQLILLALRCLAVLLLALLVSRPFVQPGSLAALLGAQPRTERIIVLDDSFSMGYTDGTNAVFDRAKRVVDQLLRWVDRERGRDTITLLLASAPDRPKLDRVSLDAGTLDAFVETLSVLEVSERRASPREVLLDVRGILDSRGDALNATVYVISDFQRSDWAGGRSAGAAEGAAADPLAALADWSGEARSLELVLVDVGADAPRNVAVTGIRSLQPQVVAGVEAEFVVSVTNHAVEAVANQELRVFVGDATLPPIAADAIAPGQTVTVPIRLIFPTPGHAVLSTETAGDGLVVDDRRAAGVPVLPGVDVLVVNGAPSPHWYLDEVTVLKAALQPEGNVLSGNRVQVIDDAAIEEVDFRAYQLVILANVFRVSESVGEALSRFVADGGGLMLFVGDQVDADVYNRVLYRDGAGLLPAGLGEQVDTPTRAGVGFAADDLTHPTTRIFQGQSNAVVGRIHFWSYVSSVPAVASGSMSGNDGATSAPSGNGAPEGPRGPAGVILAFNDADRTPAVVERAYGNGRVVLVASSCDGDWNDWSADPSYVILMLELARYAARATGASEDVLVGSPIRVQLDVDRHEPHAVLRPPRYPLEPQVDVTAVSDDASAGGGFVLTWGRTDHSGVYDFRLSGRSGEGDHRLVAVNVDTSESDLTRIDPVALEQSMPQGLAFQYVRDLALGDEEVSAARQEYWPAVLMLLLVVLTAEHTLAWWFGRRS